MDISRFDLYSQLDEHLVSFQLGDVMNKAAVKSIVQVFVWTNAFPFLLSKYLRVEWLEHVVSIC